MAMIYLVVILSITSLTCSQNATEISAQVTQAPAAATESTQTVGYMTDASVFTDDGRVNVSDAATTSVGDIISSSLKPIASTKRPTTVKVITTRLPTRAETVKTTTKPTKTPSTPKITVTDVPTTTPSPTTSPDTTTVPPSTTTAAPNTTTSAPATTTAKPPAQHHPGVSAALSFFILLIVVVVIGAGVWWLRRRRQLERLRHQLMPMYNFDPTDDVDDWENQLLQEERSLRTEAEKVQMYSGNSTFDSSQNSTLSRQE